MFTRRELLKWGAVVGGAILLPPGGLRRSGRVLADEIQSPPTRPFLTTLPIPPVAQTVTPFASPDCANFIRPQTRFFTIVEEQRLLQVHPDLPPTALWRYRDVNTPSSSTSALGPTFKARQAQNVGEGEIVRFLNQLPANHQGFGVPHTTVHLHGGHQEARSDGFPNLDFGPGEQFDYCYPNLVPGFLTGPREEGDVPGINWYHDHLLDFTGPNVYRGLAGFHLVFDELDSDNENDPNPNALRLPSGQFDIPLAFQDKLFNADGSLFYDPLNHDGFLGDKFLVNGAIQPFLRVKRRKYRFRCLNASNARFYRLYMAKTNGQTFPFHRIGSDAGLLSRPLRNVRNFQFGPAERVDIVIDFRQFQEGDEVFLENRLLQEDGRGPKKTLARGTSILKFIVEGSVPDPSRVPNVLRPFDAITENVLANATVKTAVFERRRGAWVINGEFVDLDRPLLTSRINTPEIWHLINKSGGWFHPIHLHLEFMHVLRLNGQLPPLEIRDGIAKKDVVILGPNDEADVFVTFRDFPGPFVFHCHTLEHEDMFMMARFDVVE